MPPRNTSNSRELSEWEKCAISIPKNESSDVFKSCFKPNIKSRRKNHVGLISAKRQKHNPSPGKSVSFETNRRTVMSGKFNPTTSSRALRSNCVKPINLAQILNTTKQPVSNKQPLIKNESSVRTNKNSASITPSINADPFARLSRRETFSSSHRLHNLKLSDRQNAEIYDKCNHLHGHNYVVYVILRGPIDKQTGMVYNIADLKKELGEVLDTLDHKNLDEDVEFFKSHVSTVENIALYIATSLKLSKPELLHKIKVCETEKNTASVYLNNN